MNAVSRILQRVLNRGKLEWDIRIWRKQLAPLRRIGGGPTTRTVLFCELMSMNATAKVDALIAGLLRAKGYRPLVLLGRPDRIIEAIFRAAVPDTEFVYREPGIDQQALAAAQAQADAIMVPGLALRSLVDYEIDGFRIGRNVQSMVLRRFRVGRLNEADHWEATKSVLVQSLATKEFVQRLLTSRRIDAAVFVERGYTPAGEVFDGCIANGVDVIQWCGAPQANCLIYRRYDASTRGEHPLALSEEMCQRLIAMPWSQDDSERIVRQIAANYQSGAWYNRQRLQEGKEIVEPEDVRRQLGLDPCKKTAVIFCHILYDATFFYGNSLFDDYEDWLVETVRSAIANPSLNWIVKVHPVNVWRSKMDGAKLVQLEAESLKRHFGALPDHVKIMMADTAINTYSLFGTIDYGLTVRGTIGMELPCFGIPVVTAGTGRYSGRGFTMDPPSREKYAQLLATLQDVPRLSVGEIRKARLHYYGALSLRPVPMESFDIDFDNKGPVGAKVILRWSADHELLKSPDLGRLVEWVSSGRVPELLARDFAA